MPGRATRSWSIPCTQQLPAHTPHACEAVPETLGVRRQPVALWRSILECFTTLVTLDLVLMTNKYSQLAQVHSSHGGRVNEFFHFRQRDLPGCSVWRLAIGWTGASYWLIATLIGRRLLAAALGRVRGGKRGQRGGREAAASLLLRAAASTRTSH